MLKAGDKVMIRNVTVGGPIVEGAATLRRKGKQDNFWQVEFDEEPGSLYLRFVGESDCMDVKEEKA